MCTSGSAENKDGCGDLPVFFITSFKSVILFMELKLAELPYPCAQKGVWGYSYLDHLQFGH